MKPPVDVRCPTVEQRRFAVPLRKYFGIPRPAPNRHVGDGYAEIRQDAAETLEPAPDRV